MKIHFPKIKIPKSVGHSFTKLGETAETGFLKGTKDFETMALLPSTLLTNITSGKANKLLIPLLIGGCVVAFVVLRK